MFDDTRGELPTDRPIPLGQIQVIHVSPLFSSITDRPGYDGPQAPAALANVVRLVPGPTRLPVGPDDQLPQAA